MDTPRWNRIWEIFFAALEQPAEARTRFLSEACGGDEALREEIGSLLAAHDRPAILDRAPALSAETGGIADELPTLVGRRLGHYRIEREIGAGGMGTVYEAEQEAPIRRRVAVKVIKLGMDTREVVTRFAAERQALALMSHAHIARVFDAGATEDGRPFFVMELVDGVPITDYCDTHRAGVRLRLELFVAVCEGVQHAHQKGVIHRDLKPSNVLVTLEDGRPVPKIIDFGVAKAIHQPLTEETLRTRLGLLIGTPSYMSPEQFHPDGADVDTRTDIYALSVLLYELVSGLLPFDADELRRMGYLEMQRVIRDTEARTPSAAFASLADTQAEQLAGARGRSPRDLRRELRGDLDWIALKGLSKERQERYATPGDLAGDVQRHLASQPIQAHPPGWTYRARKFIRRNRVPVAIGATALLVVLGFAISMTLQSLRLQRALQVTEVQRMRAEQVSRFLVELLQSSDPRVSAGEEVTVRSVLDAGAKRIATELEGQPAVKLRLLETMAETYREIGAYEQARALGEDGLRLAQSSGENQLQGRLLNSVGQVLHDEGDLEAAARYYEQSLAAHRAHPGDDEALGETLSNLTVIRLDLGEFAAAISPAEEALAVRQRFFGRNDASVGQSMVDLGRTYNLNGTHDRADAMYREGMATLRRTLGAGHHSLAPALNAYALFLRSRGRAPEAVALLEEALGIYGHSLGEEHAYTLSTQLNLGTALHVSGRLGEAEALLQKTVAAMRRAGTDANTVLSTRMGLATTWHNQGRFALAEREMRAVLAGDREARPDHPNVATTLSWLGAILRELGRLEESQAALDEAVAIRTRVLGADHPDIGVALVQLSLTQTARALYPQAIASAERALTLQRAGVGEEHPRIASNLAALGRARFASGDAAGGRAAFEQAVAMQRRVLPPLNPEVGQTLLDFGARLCAAGDRPAGRPLIVQALETMAAALPHDSVRLTRARSALASCTD